MDYQELHQRYGSHIAKKVQAELGLPEFDRVELEELPSYLETRAEAAHKEYQHLLDDPFKKNEHEASGEDVIDSLHRRWREAEEVAYLISVAEDVGVNGSARLAVGQA